MTVIGRSGRNEMSLLGEIRQWMGKALSSARALAVALAVFLLVGSAAYSPAQLPKTAASPEAKAEPTAPIDPLGRGTPRGAVMGLLQYEGRQDFATAARYLQPTPGEGTDLVQRAKELKALHSRFQTLVAYAHTGDWVQFTAIRQELILKLAEIVEAAGAQFAGPTQVTYLAGDATVEPGKTTVASAR